MVACCVDDSISLLPSTLRARAYSLSYWYQFVRGPAGACRAWPRPRTGSIRATSMPHERPVSNGLCIAMPVQPYEIKEIRTSGSLLQSTVGNALQQKSTNAALQRVFAMGRGSSISLHKLCPTEEGCRGQASVAHPKNIVRSCAFVAFLLSFALSCSAFVSEFADYSNLLNVMFRTSESTESILSALCSKPT
jgi:hypothetical protein